MTLKEIKAAINSGQQVFWKTKAYQILDGQIVFLPTGNCIGLTWQDGKTLNGKEEDFFSI